MTSRLLSDGRRWAVPLWAAALTVLLLWPQHALGYGLGHDMVFTPEQPLDAATFGVGSAAPRAVPVDALVALAERLVDGAVVGRFALVVPLLLAGAGVARLLPNVSLPARLAACGWAIWNPFVVERLAIGQWSLLWGYAALPWLVRALGRYRRGEARAIALVLPLAVGSITPTGGLLALLLTVVDTLRPVPSGPSRSRRLMPAVLAVVLQAPWLVAAAVGTAATTSDPAGASVFASRGEFGGALVTALSGGGIWDADVVPDSRASVLTGLALVVVVIAAVLGWTRLRAEPGSGALLLAVTAAIGLLLAVGSHVDGPAAALRVIVGDVPGGGLLRDAQKWLAPLVVLEALLVGAAVDRLSRTAGKARPAAVGLLAVGLALPLALLPDATRVVWPTLTPVRYPSGFAAAARLVRGHGGVAVLPFQPYRSFAWADRRIALDPAPRLLPATVVVDDRLQVGSTLLGGEDARAAAVADALAAGPRLPERLARAGISWVLVEQRTPGGLPDLTGLRPVLDQGDVRLYRVPGSVTPVRAEPWRRRLAAAVTIAWLALAVGSAAGRVRRRRSRSQPPVDLQGEADR